MRKRIERATAEPAKEPMRYIPHPRGKSDFTIRIESRSGDRVQISVMRWGKQFITNDGIKSARDISRGLETMLREATL